MPNWKQILNEIAAETSNSPSDRVRRKYLNKLFRYTGRNIVAYYSGFLSKPDIPGTEINDEDKNGFMLCFHQLDRKRGLDLILHTPGGGTHAAISLVEYIRSMFGDNVRAIVPQLAMSAGTMIACSCQSIVMGKQSSLGPIDPQFGLISAAHLLSEVNKAKAEIISNPSTALFWNPILQKITPALIERCEKAKEALEGFLGDALRANMFAKLSSSARAKTTANVVKLLCNTDGKEHNTHYSAEVCKSAGLKIENLEEDQTLQDLVLTIHHSFIHTTMNTPTIKIIENHRGKTLGKIAQFMPAPMFPQNFLHGQKTDLGIEKSPKKIENNNTPTDSPLTPPTTPPPSPASSPRTPLAPASRKSS